MELHTSSGWERTARALGYITSYALFTTILSFILMHSNVVHSPLPVIFLTISISALGFMLRWWL